MGRLAGLAAALALAAGCGKVAKQASGPLDQFYFPTGMAVQRYGAAPADARLLVVSSNSDLQYASDRGGSVIALDGDLATSPATYRRTGAVNVESYGGDLVIARPRVPGDAVTDPEACSTAVVTAPVAFFATRGSNTLNQIGIAADGGLQCLACGVSLTGTFADPLPVAVACQDPSLVTTGTPRASLFIGYMQSSHGEGYVTEYSLADGQFRTMDTGTGPARGLAYDPIRDRLYLAPLEVTADQIPLKYVDLAGCAVGPSSDQGGCDGRTAIQPVTFGTVELRSMALSRTRTPPTFPQRAYLTGRIYDAAAAVIAGGRSSDLGGKLFVVDLLEGGPTGLVVDLVDEVDIGHGAQDVRILPRLPSWAASRGDVLAVLSIDDGILWVYDTDTRELASFQRDPRTGAPVLGAQPFGLAVDPQPIASTARVYVGSFGESFVTPIAVPLEDVNSTGYAGGSPLRITGVTP